MPSLSRDPSVPLSSNLHLCRWVDKMRQLTQPAAVHWVDGSDEENDFLRDQLIKNGTLTALNQD